MQVFLSTKAALALLAPLCILLLLFFLLPLGAVGWSSIYDHGYSLRGYAEVANSMLIRRVFVQTLHISVVATLVSLVLGYAIAMHLAAMAPRRRTRYLVMVMLPFWISILVKSYAFTVVLGDGGLVNQLLGWISGGAWHVEWLFNRVGVILGMTNYLLPFIVLPVMASLMGQNRNLHRAAEIMGAGSWRIFTRVTLPLSLPGVAAGVLMCLTLSMGMYITPALLGGRRDVMLANLIDFYTRQTLDWMLASAMAFALLAVSVLLITLLVQVQRGREATAP